VRGHAVSLCSPLRLSPVRALSLPRAAGAHTPHRAWHIRAPPTPAPTRYSARESVGTMRGQRVCMGMA
jgi:hypothetical protein